MNMAFEEAASPSCEAVVTRRRLQEASPESAKKGLSRQFSSCSTGSWPSSSRASSPRSSTAAGTPPSFGELSRRHVAEVLLHQAVLAVATPPRALRLQAIATTPKALCLQAAAFQVPHPEKASYGGEDAFFVSKDGTSLGVADGVGEWGFRFGLNPRDFAEELMAGVRGSVEEPSDTLRTAQSPADRATAALSTGFAAVKSFGAATAVVACLDAARSALGVANLGDSGIRVLRRRSEGGSLGVVAHSEEQQHEFNKPFQLTRVPRAEDFPRLRAEGKGALVQAAKRSGSSKLDSPSDAEKYEFTVARGDLVILGSDGLFDNLHDGDICRAVDEAVGAAESLVAPEVIAEALAKAASQRSADEHGETPFSLRAKEAGLVCEGGKVDDITVVAAWVV